MTGPGLSLPRAIALATALAACLAVLSFEGVDYARDAGPPIDALIGLDPGAFVDAQPLMGAFSLLLRAPFAALAGLFGGGDQAEFQLGVFPCLLVVGLVAVWVEALMRRRGRPPVARALVAGLIMVNSVTFTALYYGHPEELLGGALCVAAILLAAHGRALPAGLVLGLAVTTKQWAVLAILPVLLAAGQQWLRVVWPALAVTVALTLPWLLGNPETYADVNLNAAAPEIHQILPTNVWWPLAHETTAATEVIDGVTVHDTVFEGPAWVNRVSRPLVVVLALPLSFLFWRRRAQLHPEDALGLFALLMLLRCAFDPLNNGYYHAPFLMAFLVWEGLRHQRLPVGGLAAAVALAITTEVNAASDVQNVFYLLWAGAVGAYLALSLFAPDVLRRRGRRSELRESLSGSG